MGSRPPRGRRKRFGAAYAGLQRGDERPVGMMLVEFETTAPGDVHQARGHGGGAGEQLAAERGRQPRREIATVGRVRAARPRRRREHRRGAATSAGVHRPTSNGPSSTTARVGGEAVEFGVAATSEPASTTRPSHSAIVSSAPAGRTPSRTGTERDHRTQLYGRVALRLRSPHVRSASSLAAGRVPTG